MTTDSKNNDKIEHLKLIEQVIERMARNSFMLKGWVCTLLAGISVYIKGTIPIYILLMGCFIIVAFWYMDSYYLKQERLYRQLYNEVRTRRNTAIDFDMNTNKQVNCNTCMIKVMFSNSEFVFYALVIVIWCIVYYALSSVTVQSLMK